MIQILENRSEVEAAVHFCQTHHLALHATPQKNWDHYLAARFLEGVQKSATLVDLGCGDAHSLAVYYQLGFTNLTGIDRWVSKSARLMQFVLFLRGGLRRRPFALRQADICATGLTSESADFLSCISVIEHGVPISAFADECCRLLKPGGVLLLTTDYWHDWKSSDGKPIEGYDWDLFNKEQLDGLVKTFEATQLRLMNEVEIPECRDRTVQFAGRSYTFVALWFKKVLARNSRQ